MDWFMRIVMVVVETDETSATRPEPSLCAMRLHSTVMSSMIPCISSSEIGMKAPPFVLPRRMVGPSSFTRPYMVRVPNE